jgi:hypothetical protein
LGFEVGCNFGELLLKRPLLPGKCEDAEDAESPEIPREDGMVVFTTGWSNDNKIYRYL